MSLPTADRRLAAGIVGSLTLLAIGWTGLLVPSLIRSIRDAFDQTDAGIGVAYLAYASAHAGSDFLEESDVGSAGLLEADEEIDYERLGPRPQQLPTAEEGKVMQAKASALVPPLTEAPAVPAAPPPDMERGDSPTPEGGDSPQGGKIPLLDSVPDGEDASDEEQPQSGEPD